MPNTTKGRIRKLSATWGCALLLAAAAGVATGGTASAADSTSPSGQSLPNGAPRGYVKIFTDDFGGTNISQRWNRYSGQPGGDPAGTWAPSHAVVDGGMLTLKGYKDSAGHYVTAGVGTKPGFNQRYGKYLVRLRMDKGKGLSYAVLLWPTVGSGPPEIDFAEDNGDTDRNLVYSFVHYGTKAVKQQSRRQLSVDMTKWHTLGVEWSPGLVRYTVDGRVWAAVPGNGVSTKSMYLAIQTQAWPCNLSFQHCPDATTPANVDMQVDWVAGYRPAP